MAKTSTERSIKNRMAIYGSRTKHNKVKEKDRERKNLANGIDSILRMGDEEMKKKYREKERERKRREKRATSVSEVASAA